MYDVRGDAEWVCQVARFVRVDPEAIDRWAGAVAPASIRPAPRPAELAITGTPAELARWVLLLDSLNFCFWAPPGQPLWSIEYLGRAWQRYGALVAALHRAVQHDRTWLTAGRWASATRADIERLFAGRGTIPLLERRVEILRETGGILLARWHGEAMELFAAADYDAPRIAAVVADEFPSFRDVQEYRGRQVAILKRAQILAFDLAAAWDQPGGAHVRGLEKLTAFADYRVPQMLRQLGVLRLEAGFEARIEAGELIPSGSDEEVELRTASIWAVELMARRLRETRGAEIPSWLVDEYLWDHSHDPQVTLQHHRTLTWYY